MTKILTINSHKGGVSKTTIVFESGDYLEQMGERVLLLDLDTSMSLTYRYTSEAEKDESIKAENTVLNLFQINGWAEPIKVSTNIDLIAGSAELASKNQEIIQGMGRRYLISWVARNIEWLEKNYDFVLIDTHNDGSVIVENAMVASDKIVVPVDVDIDSIGKIMELEHHLEEVKALEVLPTTQESYVKAQTLKIGAKVGDGADDKAFIKAFTQLMDKDESYLGWIPYSKLIAKAKTQNKPLSEFKAMPLYQSQNFKDLYSKVEGLFNKIYGI